jgi:hypothetical protein
MNRDECRAEILPLYHKHTPRCTWKDVARELETLEQNGEVMPYSRLLIWLLREGAR